VFCKEKCDIIKKISKGETFMKYVWKYEMPIGEVYIAETNGKLSHLLFGEDKRVDGYEKKETAITKETAKQVREYFEGKRKQFDIPFYIEGTPFQKSVWEALCTIPMGETRTYKDIAEQIGNPKGVRAVGMANNRNPISIIIPCHRVIGTNGSLTGYAGGLGAKEHLLELERV
jgi:O-6-methylguanine DNA methyltransferase